jgi:hypothetical protein
MFADGFVPDRCHWRQPANCPWKLKSASFFGRIPVHWLERPKRGEDLQQRLRRDRLQNQPRACG